MSDVTLNKEFILKPFHITSSKRESINKVNPREVLEALLEKYNYPITFDENNHKKAYREFFKTHFNKEDKIPLNKRTKLFSLMRLEVVSTISNKNPLKNVLTSCPRELDKYLVFLWMEGVL